MTIHINDSPEYRRNLVERYKSELENDNGTLYFKFNFIDAYIQSTVVFNSCYMDNEYFGYLPRICNENNKIVCYMRWKQNFDRFSILSFLFVYVDNIYTDKKHYEILCLHTN